MDLKFYNSSTSNKLFLFILTEIADSLFQSLFLRLDRGDMNQIYLRSVHSASKYGWHVYSAKSIKQKCVLRLGCPPSVSSLRICIDPLSELDPGRKPVVKKSTGI